MLAEVPGCPGRDPAAQRRVLERLGEVAKGQVVLGQLRLEPRPGRARLDAGRERDLIDLEKPVEGGHVD